MRSSEMASQGHLGWIWFIIIGSIDLRQQFTVLLTTDKLLQGENEQTAAGDLHLMSKIFRLVEERLLK